MKNYIKLAKECLEIQEEESKDQDASHIFDNKNLLDLLEKMDKIREILSGEKISLPSIAVIGD